MAKRINRKLKLARDYRTKLWGSKGGAVATTSMAEINVIDGITATVAELNLLDADTYDGTVEAGVTASYASSGTHVIVTLTVTNVALTVGSSENLGVGAKLFTLPAGNFTINYAFMDVNISGVTTTTDTPDVGLGTVIASGVVTVLSGTATFENIITGQTATDTNGTAIIATASPALNILTGGAHTVYLNAADGWGANADPDGVINGTVVLGYVYNEA